MYYTNKAIRLHSRMLDYLTLIKEANNRHENKRATLALYDATDNWSHPVRLMHKRHDLVSYMQRMESLAEKLVIRMQYILMEINHENDKQLRKILSTNETQTIEL